MEVPIDLRHTCATLLLKTGVHRKFVQKHLGHLTVSITLETYSHVLPGVDGQGAAGLEDLSFSEWHQDAAAMDRSPCLHFA